MLHLEAVAPRSTLDLLKRILPQSEFAGLRLVGGTALALYLGHRESVDLDLFGSWSSEAELSAVLARCGQVREPAGQGNIRSFKVDGIKVDCVNYPFAWLKSMVVEQELRLASIEDIAAMKLSAITNRGRKKDFIDLSFLLERFTLADMLDFYCRKYPEGEPSLVLRSLTYFDDGEQDPMPIMLVKRPWPAVKARIGQAVRDYLTGQPRDAQTDPAVR